MVKVSGSEKLLAAWKKRALTEEAVHEIAAELDRSPATVEKVEVIGGAHATGVKVTAAYTGDDVPRCGNDVLFWLNWHRRHGGRIRIPRIQIDGIPIPDLVRIEFGFGDLGPEPVLDQIATALDMQSKAGL